MSGSSSPKPLADLPNFTARKVQAIPGGLPDEVPDSLAARATRYLALAVVGVRSEAVTRKIALHLDPQPLPSSAYHRAHDVGER